MLCSDLEDRCCSHRLQNLRAGSSSGLRTKLVACLQPCELRRRCSESQVLPQAAKGSGPESHVWCESGLSNFDCLTKRSHSGFGRSSESNNGPVKFWLRKGSGGAWSIVRNHLLLVRSIKPLPSVCLPSQARKVSDLQPRSAQLVL